MVQMVRTVRGVFKVGPLPTGRYRTAEAPTCPYVVVGQERAAILEPGEDGLALPLLEALREIGVPRDRIAYIIATHIHLHHMEGYNVLLKELPEAKAVVHQRAVPHLLDPTRLNVSTDQIWGTEGGNCGHLNPIPENRIMGCVGGEVPDLGRRELEIVDGRGHAPHQVCIFDRLTRALWTGDLVGAIVFGSELGGPDMLPPIFDVRLHIESLHRCRALKPMVLLTHQPGGVSWVPEKTLQHHEDVTLAYERICLDGMRNGLSAREIGKQLAEVRAAGERAYSPLIRPRTTEEETGQDRIRGGHIGRLTARVEEKETTMPPLGLLAYLKREHPELQWPAGMFAKAGAGRGFQG